MKILIAFLFWLANAGVLSAQLSVTVSPPKVVGHKAVVPLTLKNEFAEAVESARAVCFLSDEQGKVAAQSTKWIVGRNESKRELASGATNVFHFVVESSKPFPSSNLTAKVSVNRVVLKGGKLANVAQDVKIETRKE